MWLGRRPVQPNVHDRVLDLLPSPHDTLQDDHSIHVESSENSIFMRMKEGSEVGQESSASRKAFV